VDALETKLLELLEPEISRLGYELVRLRLLGRDDKILQIMAETPDGLCGIGDCQTISHALSDLLDAADPLPFPYRLEVSSPGIDRPLTRAKDFARWTGHDAKVELTEPVAGRKRLEGHLVGITGDIVQLTISGNLFELPRQNIKSAKLVLTDKLLAATRPQQQIMQQEDTHIEGAN
jgi:ribosome maturation factor RimP